MYRISPAGQSGRQLNMIQNQWQQKLSQQLSEELKSVGKMDAFANTDTVQEISLGEDIRSEVIHRKLLLGCELCDKELKYLKEKSPELYDEYMASENARKEEEKAFQRALQLCSTREDVSRLKNMSITRCVARADSIAKNARLSREQKAIRLGAERRKLNDIHRNSSEFMRSGRYASLPTEKKTSSHRSGFSALQAYAEIASANAEERLTQLAKEMYLSEQDD